MIKLKNILAEQMMKHPRNNSQHKKSVNWKYTVPGHKDFTINRFGKILPPAPFDGDFGIWYDQMGSNFKPADKSNPKYAAATDQFFKDLQAYNKAKATWISTVTDKEIQAIATAEFKRDKARQDAENAEKQKELENKYNISASNGYIVVNGNKYKLWLHIKDYTDYMGDYWFDNDTNKAVANWRDDTATLHLDMPGSIDSAWWAGSFTSSDVERGNVTDFSEFDSDNFSMTIKMDDEFKSVIDRMAKGEREIKWDMDKSGRSKGKLVKH